MTRKYGQEMPQLQTTVKPVYKGHSKKIKIGFQAQLSLNTGQKYRRMLQSILQYF